MATCRQQDCQHQHKFQGVCSIKQDQRAKTLYIYQQSLKEFELDFYTQQRKSNNCREDVLLYNTRRWYASGWRNMSCYEHLESDKIHSLPYTYPNIERRATRMLCANAGFRWCSGVFMLSRFTLITATYSCRSISISHLYPLSAESGDLMYLPPFVGPFKSDRGKNTFLDLFIFNGPSAPLTVLPIVCQH